MKIIKPKKTKSVYRVRKSLEPNDEGNYILWYESETEHGCGFKQVFKGSFQECLIKKEDMEKNVRKPKKYSFSLLRRALHNK